VLAVEESKRDLGVKQQQINMARGAAEAAKSQAIRETGKAQDTIRQYQTKLYDLDNRETEIAEKEKKNEKRAVELKAEAKKLKEWEERVELQIQRIKNDRLLK
jgi:shikimate kinase